MVRIPSTNIPAQSSRIPTTSPASTTVKSLDKRQVLGTADSYNRAGRQTPAQVIDAEYVEFYSPSTQVFNQERQNLDLSLEPDSTAEQGAPRLAENANPAINSYRNRSADPVPPPGTYISIFA